MDRSEVDKIVQLRNYVIQQFQALEDAQYREQAMLKQADVALVYTTLIKSIDDLLTEYVEFKEK